MSTPLMRGLFGFRVAYLEGQKTAEETLPTLCDLIECFLSLDSGVFHETIGSYVSIVCISWLLR